MEDKNRPKRVTWEEFITDMAPYLPAYGDRPEALRSSFEANEPLLNWQEKEIEKWLSTTEVQADILSEKIKEIKELKQRIASLETVVKDADKIIKKYAKLTEVIYEHCLCERFETKGFDYHENHPRRGTLKGLRVKTPRDLIEDGVGYSWSEGGKYPKILNTRSFQEKHKDILKGLKSE